MHIFELHFNPKEDRCFDSFIYEPEHFSEKKLGSLYIVGEIKNALPSSPKFLESIASVVKNNYYKPSFDSPQKALSQDLKKANHFLSEEIKKENVSWLGNFNFAVFSIKDFSLSFTKTGDIKILLIRNGQITDLGKNLDYQEIEPYPLKVFFSVVSGKLAPDDIVLILTKEVFEFFTKNNLIARISRAENLDKKALKEILPPSLLNKSEISGICLVAVLKKQARSEPAIIFKKENKFSFRKAFSPALILIDRILSYFDKVKKKFALKGKRIVKLKKIAWLPFKKDGARLIVRNMLKGPKNKTILILVLVFILTLGFLIFKKTEEIKENNIRASLDKIEEKLNMGESFLILNEEEKANSLFKEAWLEINSLAQNPETKSLEKSLEEHLKKISRLEVLENPETLEIPKPYSSILLSNSNVYLYNPGSSDLYNLGKKELLETNSNLGIGDDSSGIIFFSKPDTIVYLKDKSLEKTEIKPPLSDLNLDLFSSYLFNLYFLDKDKCEVIKYPLVSNFQWSGPKKWTRSQRPECKPKSMAVNGSLWILNSDNSILRYYSGDFQETIKLDIFPSIENITKIKARSNLVYLYLLEPINKRIIIIDKAGKIIRQFRSEKFINLKDFTISDDGKFIWLLGQAVYKVEM